MKKLLALAIGVLLSACYTPMNNSGVSTNKPWLDVSGTRLDFNGEQYDSCFQFRLHFWPPEVQERLDLKQACISACCWRSEQNEITLDFNKNFEKELWANGHARRYTPEKVTLKVTHSNFANYTKVTVLPQGAVANSGLLKLSYEEVENPARLAQLRQAKNNSQQTQQILQQAALQATAAAPVKTSPKKSTRKKTTAGKTTVSPETEQARALLQTQMGAQIDNYFYQMNKTYRNQGAVFILSDRLLPVTSYGNNLYLITCHAKARTGLDSSHLNAADFPCGKWLVDTAQNTVTPYDDKAKLIVKK